MKNPSEDQEIFTCILLKVEHTPMRQNPSIPNTESETQIIVPAKADPTK